MNSRLTPQKQLKLGALLSYLAIGINIVSALIYSPWMLQKIGAGNYGLYTLATSLINMFMLDFGINSAVSRFVSKYLAEGKQEKINQLLGLIYKLFFIVSAIISIALILVYFFIEKIYVALTPVELEKFKIVYIIAATYSVLSFPLNTTVNGVLNSYEKFVQIKLSDVAHKIATVILIIIALSAGMGLYTLVAITAVVNMTTLLFKQLLIKSSTPVRIDFKYWDKTLLKEIFGFSVWVFINTICSRLIMNICPNILGITAGTFAITIFGFASTIEGYSYTFASALDGMFMPKIARITYGEGTPKDVLPLMIKVGRFQYHLIGLIVIGFAIVGKDFITLWLGKEYIDVYYCAVLLLLPAPFYLSQQIGKNTMVMTNNVKYLTIVNIVKAVINVILAVIFSAFWGAIGACVSICIAYFVRNIINMYLYQKKLNLNMKEFCIKCYGKMTISIILVLIIGLLMQNHLPVTSWVYLILKIAFIIILYLLTMWLISYDSDEKQVIKNLFKRIIRN